MITQIDRSALVSHAAASMFDLVNDIAAYPLYMEGCTGATVISRSDEEIVARLDLARAGIRHSFTTRNRLTRPSRIDMTLVEGPFRHFAGGWHFLALAENACKVSLHLEFQLNNRLIGRAWGALFASVANNLVSALTRRADDVLGRRG